MAERIVNQTGDKSIYIEKHNGDIYVANNYIEEVSSAFEKGSYELYDYAPTIQPAIRRDEVNLIKEWIERDASAGKPDTLALLYGKPGIGKSVVMHDLLIELQSNADYLVLGLKSDQIEFVDTDELSKNIHLAKPIEEVVKEESLSYKRIVLLIDQIDALSLSLSSNRTPLRSLLKFIGQIKYLSNVRIVISCRPYDLEYDPLLDNLHIRNKWEIKEFSVEKVKEILNQNQHTERLNDRLLQFLGNPLHLYLFLKVNPSEQLTDPLSTDLLYHQLWKKYVLDGSVRKVDKFRLLDLLDAIVDAMYDRQELSVQLREFETNFSAELQYLFTNGFLIKTQNSQIQFFHQTLFDYVYARRFIERKYDILKELRGRHQGLFLRAAVKSILSFLREQNSGNYVQTIEKLLYDKSDDGKETYRYHLKSLALSNMAYYETPLKEELSLISRRVFQDMTYMAVIFESVYSSKWFNSIWSIIDKKGGWKSLSKEYRDKVMLMCDRALWQNTDDVLGRLDSVIDYTNVEDCNYLSNLLQHYNLNCDSKQLISFYKKLVKTRLPLEHIHLLQNILKTNPDFVCQELKENIRQQLVEKESQGIHRIGINHEVERLYEGMLKRHHDIGINLLIDILFLVYEETKFELNGSEIYNSTEFWSFRRTTGGHFLSNFVEDVANILIDDFLANIDNQVTRRYISDFSKSKHEGFVFIALYIFTSKPEKFKYELFDLIMNRSVLANAPSWVEYQAIEALKVSYPLWNEEQKIAVINRILAINDLGERILFKDAIENRIQYGHPLLDIDIHKGKALEVIPKDELRNLSWIAYQERQRIDRKFKENRLKNDEPSHMSSHSGWSSLSEEKGLRMNCETWLKSMLVYDNNPFADWERPSLTGQCHLFRMVVSKQPDKFINLINDILKDDRILLAYPQAGMQGLLDAGRLDEAMSVLDGILKVIKNDLNSTFRSFSLHSLLFALNDIPKMSHVPEPVFKLFCNALVEAEEQKDDNHKEDKDIANVGINQSRGNAGYLLVECAKEGCYGEEIFKTIESIADSASVYTRAAILLNMASLNFIDTKRNVALFKKLMHDCEPRLMSMPVHNYNPLVYFVNYALDDLIEFFGHVVECQDCYREQVIILWLAWAHNNRDARVKEFLDKVCETSQEARISLLNFLGTLEHKMNEDAIDYILRFLEPKYNTAEIGEAYDGLFLHAEEWAEEYQFRIAEAYVKSPVYKNRCKSFIGFLGGYAIKDPIQTLKWLDKILQDKLPEDYYLTNSIVDVLIQSYNGIKKFNDSSNQETLEHAMDLIDSIMRNPGSKYLISNFVNKLDNE